MPVRAVSCSAPGSSVSQVNQGLSLSQPPTFFFDVQSDGWFHLVMGPYDAFRTPFGVILFIVFAPFLRWIPRGAVATYLTATSLALAYVTLGQSYAVLIFAATLYGLLVTRTAERAVYFYKLPARGVVAFGTIALLLPYAGLLWVPQPSFLPPVREPLYFYLQWAGIGYLALRALHVLVERCKPPPHSRSRITALHGSHYFAFLLFVPTLRMGPLYRYNDFVEQLETQRIHQSAHNLGAGLIRIMIGFVRLGLMLALSQPWFLPLVPLESDPQFLYPRFNIAPESMPYWQVMAGAYAQPMRIYLWMSGYMDLAVGVGLLCGFTVPENFDYPWFTTSIRTFWRRWHITFGAWLRDYIFIPLGGSRRHVWRNYFLTFLFVGLWHGLYPSYIAWGISQGLGLSVNRRWHLYWEQKRQQEASSYRRLQRIGLTGGGRLGRFLAWVLTINYQIITMSLFMDEQCGGLRFIPVLLGLEPLI